ncbi:MAG: RNA polymerase sigma factor [Pseudomonadales bacterium]
METPAVVEAAISNVLSHDRGQLLAGLIARLNDFQLAEDALQDASVSALSHWARSGVPHSPKAWLMRAALNKGIDRIRSRNRELKKAEDLSLIAKEYDELLAADVIPDERLRLIFTCCHPAIDEKSRVALTLRTVCNLTTREIAAAFLDTDSTMGQRLSRAKAKIKSKGIGFSVPEPDQWPARLDAVLVTLYLIFTTGYVAQDEGPRDLCKEALFLVRLLDQLQPEDPEIAGALALMLLAEARKPARINALGASVPIASQDHELWQQDLITEAQQQLSQAIIKRQPGPFQIKAAIADCHMADPGPDWPQMLLLYQSLWRFEPTPVVALNWAVVLAETGKPETALQHLNTLAAELADFQPWHAASASVLRQLGRTEAAQAAYRAAIDRAPNIASRAFLEFELSQMLSSG